MIAVPSRMRSVCAGEPGEDRHRVRAVGLGGPDRVVAEPLGLLHELELLAGGGPSPSSRCDPSRTPSLRDAEARRSRSEVASARRRARRRAAAGAAGENGLVRNRSAPASTARSCAGPSDMRGEHDDRRVGGDGVRAQPPAGLDAVEPRHVVVEEDDLRPRPRPRSRAPARRRRPPAAAKPATSCSVVVISLRIERVVVDDRGSTGVTRCRSRMRANASSGMRRVGGHDRRVELRARVARGSPAAPSPSSTAARYGPVRRQRVERVGDGEHARRRPGSSSPREPVRVAACRPSARGGGGRRASRRRGSRRGAGSPSRSPGAQRSARAPRR